MESRRGGWWLGWFWLGVVVLLCVLGNGWLEGVRGGTFSIDDFGAVANDSSDAAGWANTAAIVKAWTAANTTEDGEEKVILIPALKEYYVFNVVVTNMFNTTFRLDGELKMSTNISAWPTENGGGGSLAALYIGDSSYITLEGSGLFNGLGYQWWWYVIVTGIDNRPNMIYMHRCENVLIHQLTFIDSPEYHLYLSDMKDLVVRNIVIHVDVEAQEELLAQHGLSRRRQEDDSSDPYGADLPIFPLNTDGIDPSGINVLIENVVITNYDDAVAVKPMNGGGKFSNCSSNMLIRNLTVYWGVGMSIGSVPPNPQTNCIRDIVFDQVTFHHPFKALYIKTNPGDEGDGIIDNITYSNIDIHETVWYPIWFGPQQEHQPHQQGKGCSFFYPLVDTCETQPRVPISNVYVVNVTMHGVAVPLPGVIMCNETRPCTNFVLQNVSNGDAFLFQDNYVCRNVVGTAENSTPVPPCFTVVPAGSIDGADSSSLEEKEGVPDGTPDVPRRD